VISSLFIFKAYPNASYTKFLKSNPDNYCINKYNEQGQLAPIKPREKLPVGLKA
jgi:hypothetical protein